MTTQVDLPEKLDTSAVPALIETLRAHQGANLVLNAAELRQVGGLAVQTIVVAANDWQDAGHRLSLESVTEEVREQLRLLGTGPDVLTEGDIR